MKKLFGLIVGCVLMVGCKVSEPPQSPKPTNTKQECYLYTKNVYDNTMKIATFYKSELVGGTTGDQRFFFKYNSVYDYSAYFSCTDNSSKHSWCECTRGPNRVFEDSVEKTSPHLIWID